jgi:hypothetical protein
MPHMFAEFGSDRSGIGLMAINGDPIGVTPLTALADRKNALAAAMSRCSLSMTSY